MPHDAAQFPIGPWLLGLGAATALMLALWLRQLRTRDATSVDVAWTFGIGALALTFAATGSGSPAARVLAAAIAVVWSGRLGMHLVRDRLRPGAGEDGRYRALRQRLGPRAAVHFVWVYLLQGLLVAVFATPFLVLASHPGDGLTAVQGLGLAVFAGGLWLEHAADRRLAAHRRDPRNRGRTCRAGPWRYSRHPNYFGEWLAWCGIALLCAPTPLAAYAWPVPVLLFVLVRFVSGVPFAEQQALRSRGDDYRAYMAVTNAFFPWPPRRPALASDPMQSRGTSP
ncbi:MAG: DUF1295 domain-containing protein [Planctomycetota bacterium]